MGAHFSVVGVSVSFLTLNALTCRSSCKWKSISFKALPGPSRPPLLLTYSSFPKTNGRRIIFLRKQTCFQLKRNVEGGLVLVGHSCSEAATKEP